ncbi:MAG TPA: hypothetical protein PK428_14100 [Phycicoccus sp.]|nr:hypothetical protein [Phycicoccus sp.]
MSTHPSTDQRPLDTFETALLGQLTAVVDERAAQVTTSPSRRLTGRPARWAAAVAAAAAGTAALLVLPGGATPAYAVESDSSGSVTVTINQLADASALKDALAAKGITADVTYPGVGKQCAAGRFTEAPAAGGPPSEANAFKSSVGSGGFSMTIPKNMIQPGQTLVLESVWPDSQSWMVKVAIANGPVGACQLVDADPMFMPPAGPAPAGGSNEVEPTAVATAQ